MRYVISVVLAMLFALPVWGRQKLACYEEPGTRQATCINEGAVLVNGATRASPIYRGGPNGVRKTGYLMVTNCGKGIVTLQDSDGVNFGGGFSNATPVSEALTQWMCAASKPIKAPKLRQF